MRIAVDISLYPLTEQFIPPIKDVIARLAAHEDIDVLTNASYVAAKWCCGWEDLQSGVAAFVVAMGTTRPLS